MGSLQTWLPFCWFEKHSTSQLHYKNRNLKLYKVIKWWHFQGQALKYKRNEFCRYILLRYAVGWTFAAIFGKCLNHLGEVISTTSTLHNAKYITEYIFWKSPHPSIAYLFVALCGTWVTDFFIGILNLTILNVLCILLANSITHTLCVTLYHILRRWPAFARQNVFNRVAGSVI